MNDSEEVRRLIGKPKPMQRRGFRRAEETDPATGETVTGWRWQRKRRRA